MLLFKTDWYLNLKKLHLYYFVTSVLITLYGGERVRKFSTYKIR